VTTRGTAESAFDALAFKEILTKGPFHFYRPSLKGTKREMPFARWRSAEIASGIAVAQVRKREKKFQSS